MSAQYKVIGQVQQPSIDPATGKVTQGWTVTFKDVFTGVVGSVFVPQASYPQGVSEAISEQVAAIRQVNGLTGAE